MAGTKNPSSRRDREAARAPSFSPMMMGMIGEGEVVCLVREVRRAMLWFSFFTELAALGGVKELQGGQRGGGLRRGWSGRVNKRAGFIDEEIDPVL